MKEMIKKIIKVIKREGIFGFCKLACAYFQLKKRLIRLILGPIAIPIAGAILAMSPWRRIRLIMLYSNRIGHYAWNTEFWLSALKLSANKEEKKYITLFYTVPGYAICNTQLHKMWKRVIPILPLPYLVAEVDRYLMNWSQYYRNEPFKRFFKPGGGSWDAWNLVGKSQQPHIYFTPMEQRKGAQLLAEMGIPEGAPYVCILGRDSSYIKTHMPHADTSIDDYRDVDINNYQQAAEYLVNQGYYVLRMGKYVRDHFKFKHPQVIDYANSQFRSDFADIYLSAHCHFFISVATGLDSVPYIFKRPILQTNVPNFDGYLWPDWLLFITKKVFDQKAQSFLSPQAIAEIFAYDKTDKGRRMPAILSEQQLTMVENTPEEIVDAVKEMVGLIQGTWKYSIEDEQLQHLYWKFFKDSRVASLSAPIPLLTVPVLKAPVFDYANLELNKKIMKVYLRLGSAFLRQNQSWIFSRISERQLLPNA